MRVFQTFHKYNAYITHFEKKYDVKNLSFKEHLTTLINDRFYALHILKPCLNQDKNGFFTMWDYDNLQHKWAEEKGWNERNLKKILFAQIEEFNPAVFYNGSPLSFAKEELSSYLSKNIRRICWSASPDQNPEKFKLYDTRLTNFPLDIRPKKEVGFRNDYFEPAHDPIMDNYSKNKDRPIDLFFYGQFYEAAFKNRNEHIRKLIDFKQKSNLNIEIALQYQTKKGPLVNIPYVRRYLKKIVYPSKIVRQSSVSPLYGLDLYSKISKSKIVFNAGVDFSKNYKVNMRNFEVMGCGAHLISDKGIYPDGFKANENFTYYNNIEECIEKVTYLIKNKNERLKIAEMGTEMVKKKYSKNIQWENFKKIVESL